MFLVAGLGNPEPRYVGNRHNVGFMVVEELARRAGVSLASSRFNARAAKTTLRGADVLLLQPMTFMNRSGGPVAAAVQFFKLCPSSDLVVVHDELDLDFGAVRIKQGGGTAGHNGLRSIAGSLCTNDFVRIRFGIGRPQPGCSVTTHVLSDFSGEEEKELRDRVDLAADAFEAVLLDGPVAAMNAFHAPRQDAKPSE